MKLKITIAITILTLNSCHILQKDKLTLKKLNQKEELHIMEQRNTLSQHYQLVMTDSSHNDFTMLLWPKGKFTFSAAKGFEGEAEKIIIKGSQASKNVLNLKRETKRDSSLLKADFINQRESSTAMKKNKLSFGFSWVWFLAIPIFYLLYRVYLRYKKG